MDMPNRWESVEDHHAVSAHDRFCLHTQSLKRSGFYLLLLMMATAAYAQIPSQNSPSDQSGTSNNLDCADPLLGSTTQCSDQSQYDQSQYPTNQQLLQQNRSGTPANYGTQSQNLRNNYNNNYEDTEPFTQQLYGISGRTPTSPAALPPEQLTEFQKFIASTTEQILPIYGAALFRRVPSTFAPVETAPVPSDYVIGPGDELRIRIWGQLNFTANVRVDRSGDIYLQQVGPVHVAGMPFSALEEHLRSAIQRVYHNFELTVDIGQIRAIQVYVAGEARRPGVYTVSSLSTLVDALFASGGPSLQGSLRHILLRRESAVIADFDLYDLLVHGDKSKDSKLLPGDVIFIPPVGAQVAVTGSVRVPAIYELKEKESLADVIAAAGGVSAVAAEARVSIERIDDHRDRHAMEVAFDASGLATPLGDGDLVRVYSIAPAYRKTVVLRGNIANPGRFAWHPGMHLSELIPDKESLVTRNYWWKRTQLGFPAPEFEPTPNLTNLRQPTESQTVPAVTPRSQELGGSQGLGGFTPDEINAPRSSGEMGALNEAGLQQDQFGSQQDLSTLSQNQQSMAQQRAGNAPLAAAQMLPSAQGPRAMQRTDVRILAPEIDWDYAVIDRQDPDTLKTMLIPFDLGKLVLQHDPSQDIELQPGDVVSVFSEADIRVPIAQQTKFVRLAGEFVHAGVYSAQPGETLRHLVERAGGFTPNAYLYGSQFTRESTRAVQQAGIDQYLQTLNLQIQQTSLTLASSPTSSAQPAANGALAQTSAQNLLSQLRLIRATGRIVLQFKPDSSGTVTVPDILVEDGDSFIVPPVPNSINVIGAIYDQNSFLYSPERRAGTYLLLAGGPNSSSDQKHEFIIRADGEVVSREKQNGLWGNEFNNLRINPGDTIVVPEKSLRPSALRGFIDWSQMFSQFALGAAALSVIR
jgi:protein involved in polysaccharide export with SLBB domain